MTREDLAGSGEKSRRLTALQPTTRERFRNYMAGRDVDRPPMFEAQIPSDTVDLWRTQGLPQDKSPCEYFCLDERERVPMTTARVRRGMAAITDLRSAQRAAKWYSKKRRLYPPDWRGVRGSLRASEKVVYADPYARGFFQEMGVSDWASLRAVLLTLSDEPEAAESLMSSYAEFLVELIELEYPGLDIDCAIYSEPIAHPKAPVISPSMYRRFVLPCLARVVEAGKRIGIREHIVWSMGGVRPLIPLWLEAGINGLWIGHAAEAGIDYLELRRELGPEVSLWGGVDSRALTCGRETIEAEIVRIGALFASGRYMAMLDDTVRPQISFEAYADYRRRIEGLFHRDV